MHFVVDEASVNFNGLEAAAAIEALESLLDQVERGAERGEATCYSTELFYWKVLGERTLYDLYVDDSPLPIPDDVRRRIATIFDHLPKWDDSDDWPAVLDVAIGTAAPALAPSVAWAHARAKAGVLTSVACLALQGARAPNSVDVSANGVTRQIWFVLDETSRLAFFRWKIVCGTTSATELENFANSAFPELDFIEGVFGGIKSMSKGYRDLVDDLVRHLGALSDYGKQIFSGPWQRAPAEFGPYGVDISDENGQTKADKAARAERTKKVGGKPVVFWWHTKLERDRDRIHIFPDQVPGGGRLIVGIFRNHLK